MLEALTGRIVERGPTHLLVETGGVVLRLDTPLLTASRLAPDKKTATLHCHLYFREDALRLYGFASREERDFFRMLLGVTGVGPALALSLLSGARPEHLRETIAAGKPEALEEIRGIGPKTARRLIAELKDAVGAGAASGAEKDPVAGQVARALASLGYPPKVARDAVAKALADRGPDAPPAELESLLRAALSHAR